MAFKPRINIFDVDQTTITGGVEDVYDIAFIPGFANVKISSAPSGQATADDPDEVISKDGGVIKVWKKIEQGVATNAEWAAYEPTLEIGGTSVTLDLSDIAQKSEDVTNEDITGDYLVLYTVGADRNTVTVAIYTASSETGTDPATEDTTTIGTISLWDDDEAYAACLTVGTLGLSVSQSDVNNIAVTSCTTAAVAGYTYELDAEKTAQFATGRFNSYAEFTSVIGSTPMCVWGYKDKNSAVYEYSFKKLYDYAEEQVIGEGKEPNAINVNSYINEHLSAEDAVRIIWVDKNWLYAAELLKSGLPIFYYVIDGYEDSDIESATDPETGVISETSVDNVFRGKFILAFKNMYAEMADRGEYDYKYLTTGAFGLAKINPASDISEDVEFTNTNLFDMPFYAEGSSGTRTFLEYLTDIANYRKDCLVLADAIKSYDQNGLKPTGGEDDSTVYTMFENLVKSHALANLYSGDIMTLDEQARAGRRVENTFPWINVTCYTFPASWSAYRVDGNVFTMPGSFIYLSCLASSLQKYPTASWQAIAGVTRSLVPNFVSLDVADRLSNAIADAYNQRNRAQINAVTNIRPYGYCIWGNGTLVDNEYFSAMGDGSDGMIASSFVDIMSMVCNVNKVAYRAAKRLMFEKNNDILWTRFRQNVEPYLDSIVTGGGLKTYELKKIETNKRGHLKAQIILYPVYALDSVDVEIILRDTEEQV